MVVCQEPQPQTLQRHQQQNPQARGQPERPRKPSLCLIFVILALALAGLALWSITYTPCFYAHPSVQLDSATVARFQLDADGVVLAYDLALNMTLRNYVEGRRFTYYKMAATASYAREEFGYADLLPSSVPLQPETNTTDLSPAFRGQMPLHRYVAAEFLQEEAEGLFTIDVELSVVMMVQCGDDDTRKESSWAARWRLRLPPETHGPISACTYG